MEEQKPVPINRGIEIQKAKIEEILRQATSRYKELAAISRALEDRLDAELSIQSTGTDHFDKLMLLLEQKHAFEEIGRELEALILRNFAHQDELMERWHAVEGRIAHLENDTGDNPTL